MNSIRPEVTGRAAYSVAEVMIQTGLGRDSIYRAIKSKQLVAHKMGRRTIILATDVQRYLESLPTMDGGETA